MSSLELALHEAEILLGHVPPAGRIQNVWRHYHARRAHRYALCRAATDKSMTLERPSAANSTRCSARVSRTIGSDSPGLPYSTPGTKPCLRKRREGPLPNSLRGWASTVCRAMLVCILAAVRIWGDRGS
jgi:hypothetical protein